MYVYYLNQDFLFFRICVPKYSENTDVYNLAEAIGTFKTLLRIGGDELTRLLSYWDHDVRAVTLFAPTDEAFAKLPEGVLDSLPREEIIRIVSRHVVNGTTILAADVTNGPVLTASGENISLIKDDQGGFKIRYGWNFFNVVDADLKATNGVIHVIDNFMGFFDNNVLNAKLNPNSQYFQNVRN